MQMVQVEASAATSEGELVSSIARERQTKSAQWLRFTVSFETGEMPLACTSLIPLGPDQARGVIASFVRRAFGRTSLRGVARIRQAALAVILFGATRAGSFADGDIAGAENAWDASGGHVHGGAPPQL